ncbi:hypothetical protein NM208_g6001 [Fusarium decemcellulare]|uniref:Uncharacterized protein n=1 Tax=Fusarium decemcellulare TaxID=57161 RepID=A0ACC1SES8_9HYPO|nr:hypothetical protein NM208_g6001 [Fusarium decemcellulare]
MDLQRGIYTSLSTDGPDFRLLILQPGSWDEDITCELEIATLSKTKGFEALSYTWGDASDLRPITVNDISIRVTTNLHSALLYLRQPTQSRVLWIDALCINQADTQEKEHQVQRMGQIFSSATTVLAWLGPPSSDSDEAMKSIIKIGETLSPIFRGETVEDSDLEDAPSGWDELNKLSPTDLRELGLDIGAMNWDAIWSICERSFWHRVWIIQELVLSGDLISNLNTSRCNIGCGSIWTSLENFSAFVLIFGLMRVGPKWSQDNTPATWFIRGSPPAERMFEIVWSLDSMFADDDKGEEEFSYRRSLGFLLRLSKRFQATECRDKLYAFLEVADSQLVTPDYSLSPADVYKNWIKGCIERDGNLHCLLGNRELTNDFGPSWIPELYGRALDGFAWTNTLFQHLESASKGIQHPPATSSFLENDNVLQVRGVSLGVLDQVFGPFSPGFVIYEPLATSRQKLQQATISLFNLYSSLPDDLQEKVWRAMIMDSDTSDRDQPTSPAPNHFGQLWRVFVGLEDVPEDFGPGLPKNVRTSMYNSPFTASLDNALYSDRCFFVMEDSQMGLGPYATQPGDEVVLLFGSPLCFVLRPEGGRYRLVGDAYVQDVHPGSALIDLSDDKMRVKDFLIH